MDRELEELHCCVCGIFFAIEGGVADNWRKSHHSFTCPNGHSQSWQEKTDDEKELISLRKEVESLREQLTISKQVVAKQADQIVELQGELDIWHPETGSIESN